MFQLVDRAAPLLALRRNKLTAPNVDAETAARILQRRMKAKQRYRRRRDRKIAVDYLGRVFEYSYRNMETGQTDWFQFQITRYNPENHTIVLKSMDDRGTNTWDTDSFWLLLRSGDLSPL